MTKIAVLTRGEYRNTGIETVEKHTVPWLLDNIPGAEPIEFEPRDWYPLSQTIEKLLYGRRLKKKIQQEGYDKVLISSQEKVLFDPSQVDAEVIPFIHDILPVTTQYTTYSKESLSDRIAGYLSSVMAVRYIKFIANCSTAICSTETTQKELFERTGFNGDSHVVYYGVDTPDPGYEGERDIDLLYVGSLIERKNPEFIRSALEEAEQAGFKVATVNFEELDLPGETFVDISDEELAQLYCRSRFYLHPSWAEGFGLGPVEAQRQGCVPLALDIPINREVLGDEGRSWLRIRSVEDVLDVLADSPSVVREAAVENSNRFRWSKTREKILRILMD